MPASCKIIFHLTTSVIGIILGLSAFIAFFCVYDNKNAAVWGLISGVLAAVCFQLHYLQFRERLDNWHSPETLRGMKVLGVMGLIAGLAGLAWYIFIASYKHIPLLPVDGSAYIAAIWAFMEAKWGFLLIVYAQYYIRKFEEDNPRLIRL